MVGAPIPGLPSKDDLARLPLRALVALAARTARRVESYARPGSQAATADALDVAERFARGEALEPASAAQAASRAGASAYEVYADAHRLADATADANSAFRASAATTAAAQAANAVAAASSGPGAAYGPAVASAASSAARAAAHVDKSVTAPVAADYQKLLDLGLGTFPEMGKPIDPAVNGPLGPL